jgi:hypothetical protein
LTADPGGRGAEAAATRTQQDRGDQVSAEEAREDGDLGAGVRDPRDPEPRAQVPDPGAGDTAAQARRYAQPPRADLPQAALPRGEFPFGSSTSWPVAFVGRGGGEGAERPPPSLLCISRPAIITRYRFHGIQSHCFYPTREHSSWTRSTWLRGVIIPFAARRQRVQYQSVRCSYRS